MKKKNINSEQNVENESKECCSNHKCKFCYAFFTIALVILCAVGEHFFNKHNLSKISEDNKVETLQAIEESKKDYDLSVSSLKKDVSSLKTEVSKIVIKDENVICTYCKKMEFRKKWKTWLALKTKMEASEAFGEELEAFNALFHYDKELIAIVNDLAKGVDVIANVETEKEDVIDTCKRYLRKVVRVKKIDYRKLLEVSGYVLSSIKEE